jgi:hypothetical protein
MVPALIPVTACFTPRYRRRRYHGAVGFVLNTFESHGSKIILIVCKTVLFVKTISIGIPFCYIEGFKFVEIAA